MVRSGAQRSDHLRCRRRITQTDGEVAQPALVADAPDRRAAQALVELRFGPRKQLHERGSVQAVPCPEIPFSAELGEAVPRADKLAVVAAVDPVADERAQLLGDRAFVLDREVRDAAPGVELVGAADRLRGTDLDAALTGAAMVLLPRVEREGKIAVDLAEEEPEIGRAHV